jgi:1,4-alpha-glucan branching enzyme
MRNSALVPVTFRFPHTMAPAAHRIAILGPFNGWNPMVHLLTKSPDAYWTITLYLPPGRTVYCFDVDGSYWLDPHDEGRVPNGWGSEYSVRYVRQGDELPAAPHSTQDTLPHQDDRHRRQVTLSTAGKGARVLQERD